MLSRETWEELKQYTMIQLEKAERTAMRQLTSISLLRADMVFEEGMDIFINLHLRQANSLPNQFHGHDFFELTYVLKGKCIEQMMDEDEFTLHEGALCIMNPNVRHRRLITDDDSIVLNLALKKDLFNATFWSLLNQQDQIGYFFLNYFLSHNPTYDYMLFEIAPGQEIDHTLERICTEYLGRSPYFSVTLHCLLIIFFTDAVRASTKTISQNTFPDKASAKVISLFNYLSINYATATLASTAEYFHYHPNYLSAFIKKNTGRTFRSILNDIRLSQAIYYLNNTNLSIREISEEIGFGQLCNFYDFIRKNLHTTPQKYRSAHRGKHI